jgi:transcriptional regulator with XRE-family HTH domain
MSSGPFAIPGATQLNQHFPTQLRIELALHDLTLEELAQASGISRQSIAAILSGRHQAKPSTIRRLQAGIHKAAEKAVPV